ncbi:hypothetical protein GNI_017810, partial [Gregarina niphandrodes]
MLIDEHAIETCTTYTDIVRSVLEKKSFKFSVSKDRFRHLYDKALDEILGRVVTDEVYDYVWRVTVVQS